MKIQMEIILAILITAFQIQAQHSEAAPSPIVFIYDASGSMWGQIQGKTKMEVAVEVLSQTINKLPENQKIGFVAYGHREEGNCEDVEFLIDINNESKSQVIESLKKIKPLGKTPLAFSAMQVIDRLRKTSLKATIILLTDGIESCKGDICEVVQAAKKEGINFKLHIIGFGLKAEETEQLKCAAQAGDGNYYDAADAGGLSGVLDEATSATVDKPAGNYSVFAVKNGKPIDAYIRAFKAGTKTTADVQRTYADTAFLYLPAGKYDLEVQPLAGSDVTAVTIAGIRSFEEKIAHQTVSFDAGKLNIKTLNNGKGWDAVVNVYSLPDGKQAAAGRTYGKTEEIELNPGQYRVELKALEMKGSDISHNFERLEVKANTEMEIVHNFKSGIAMIGAKSAGGLVDATVSIVNASENKNVANGRTYTSETSNPKKFLLNPGVYEVTLKALGEHRGKRETFTITVNENETVTKVITF